MYLCAVQGILSLIGLHLELRYENSQIVEHSTGKPYGYTGVPHAWNIQTDFILKKILRKFSNRCT